MHDNAVGTKQAAQSVNTLAGLADELRASALRFKIPKSNQPTPEDLAEPTDSADADVPISDTDAQKVTPIPLTQPDGSWPTEVVAEAPAR
jgi:hypothetical protein